MKYKVGDKVKIKTWDQMKKEFGLSPNNSESIDCRYGYMKRMERDLLNTVPDRIVTIKDIREDSFYRMDIEGYSYWNWSDDMIEGLAENINLNIFEDISNRFELIDFD
jgi:hypothetical protein